MASNDKQTKAERQQSAREKARQMQEEQRRQEKRRSLMVRWGVVIGVVVVVAVVVGVIFMNSSRSIPDAGPAPTVANEYGGVVLTSTTELAPSEFGGEQVDASAVEVPETPSPMETVPGLEERGAGDPAQIIIYADANCVHCASFEAENAQKLNEWLDAGKATVEYRLLDFLDNPATGNYSSRAANASLCVAEGSPENYNSFVTQVFASYTGEGMSDDDLKSMASGLGADVNGCIDGNTYRPYVKYTGATARADGVSGTPTVFVNGQNWSESVEEGQSFTDWAQSVMDKKA
jgi:protein-disulfide isomerase